MALRFKNRLSNGRFGKISVINTGITKEKLNCGLNSWREEARIADEPPPKLPRLINTRAVTVRKKQLCLQKANNLSSNFIQGLKLPEKPLFLIETKKSNGK